MSVVYLSFRGAFLHHAVEKAFNFLFDRSIKWNLKMINLGIAIIPTRIKNIVILGYVYESIFSSYSLNNSCHFVIAILAY